MPDTMISEWHVRGHVERCGQCCNYGGVVMWKGTGSAVIMVVGTRQVATQKW